MLVADSLLFQTSRDRKGFVVGQCYTFGIQVKRKGGEIPLWRLEPAILVLLTLLHHNALKNMGFGFTN
jgi:hypothetical protein